MDPDFDGSDGPDRWRGKTQTETAELKRQDEERPRPGRLSFTALWWSLAASALLALLIIFWLLLR